MKTKLHLTFFFAFIYIGMNAQAPDWLWANNAGESNDDYGQSVCMDASGNVYVTGFFSSDSITFGSFTLGNSGNKEVFVVKYDANGNALWAKSANGSNEDRAYGICVDANGNVFITGFYSSSTITFDTYALSSPGIDNIFLVKYDAAGNVLWARSAGGSSYDIGYGVITDPSGNAYITGGFQSSAAVFGSDTIGSFGSYDIFLAKYDANGNELWVRGTGGSGVDVSKGVSTDASGNAIITGSFSSGSIYFESTTLTLSGSSYTDMFVAEYDAWGNALWAKNAVGNSYDYGYSVCTDASDNVFVTGYFRSATLVFYTTTLTNSNVSGSMYDIFVAKYSPYGNLIWAKSAGESSGDDIGQGVSVGAGGSVFFTGYFQSPSITFGSTTLTNTSSSADIVVAKYDAAGNVLWAKSSGTANSDKANGISANLYDNAVITGFYYGAPITFGSTTLTNNGVGDIFVAKLDFVTGIATEHSSLNTISVFPNPFSLHTILCTDKYFEKITLSIYNSIGQQIKQIKNINGQTFTLQRDNLPSGLYFLILTQDNKILTTDKIVITDK